MKHDWEYKKLGEVCDFERGLTYSKNDESPSPTSNIVLRSNNVDLETKRIVFDDLKYLVSDYQIPESKMVRPQTILMCMSNGSMQHVGKVAYIDKNCDAAFGGFMGLLLPKQDCCSKYIFYFLNSPTYRHFLLSIANGINITNLKFSDLQNLTIPVPPLPIQQQIVAELDKVSDIIEKKKQQVKELDNLAQSIFYDMFGDPVENEKGWEVKRFKDSCKRLFAGGDVPKDDFSKERTSKYTIPIFSNGVERKGLYGYTSTPRETQPCITIAGRGTIGYCVIRTEPFFPIIRLIVAVPNEKLDVCYFKYLIDALSIKGNGGAIPQLTIPMIKDRLIPIPPFSLQQSFAQKIEAIEKQKELITASIKEAQTLFDARMDYWFGE